MTIKILQYIFGYISFKVSGGFLERFINLCNLSGLQLHDISKKDGVLYAKTDIDSYKKMHSCARKTGSKVKCVEKKGLPFLLGRYRHRAGLLVGICIFAVTVAALSNFVWLVDVEGTKNLDKNEIIAFCEENGLKKGVLSKKVDKSYIENKLMAHYPQVSWVNINSYGSHFVVELREGVLGEERIEKDKPCNIKASTDAQIVRMEVYEGFAAVKEGDSVVKGDLLVSAVSESQVTGNTFYKHSNALVIGRTTHEIKLEVPTSEENRKFTGKVKKRDYIMFFNIKIPLYVLGVPKGNYKEEKEDKDFVIDGVTLPISYHKQRYKEYIPEQRKLTDGEIKKKGEDLARKELMKNPKITETQDEKFEFVSENSKMFVKATFVTLENIGVTEEILIEN